MNVQSTGGKSKCIRTLALSDPSVLDDKRRAKRRKFVVHNTLGPSQPAMPFDRWTPTWPRTWPYAVFKKHHTELNDLYWSNAAAAHHAAMTSKSGNSSDELNTVLAIPRANARRVNFTIARWRDQIKESENWIRLNALMGLSGYLETYLHGVVTLALTSDPGLLISSPRSVDGIALVKRGRLPEVSQHVVAITKGTWPERLAKYKALFTQLPTELESSTDDLEAMRRLRNGVGHAFGRNLDGYREPLMFMPRPLQRLSEERLQKWLGTVDTAASAIEDHLRGQHLGAIEALLHYHAWDKKYPAGHQSEEQAFRRRFPDAQGNPPTVAYFRQLIAYYRGA